MPPANTFIIPSSPMDRRTLGKFEVLCRLSTGGMSEIYLAQQGGVGGFNKLVVLKTILPDIVGEEDFVRMFLDEARTTAAFNHPNIAQVFELDTAQETLFMAMEFVQGCTLVEMARACRAAREAIPMGLTLAAVRDTALALHYAHGFVDPRGRRQIVIHRDVAEKNIMVTYEGVTKLLDFGIAKALGRSGRTSIGMVKGTSGYMSPEQIRGEPLDPRSDIFSLGVVMHECLTGLRLFHGKNAEEGMMAALKGEVAPPSKWNSLVSSELDGIVLKALAKDRDARFATALEMARAIERAAPGLIWHPEQVGELVMRHFKERRAETRRVLEAAFGHESTGEVRVQSIIAKMKASSPSSPGTPEPRKSNTTLPPQAATNPLISATTQPGITPHTLSPAEQVTTPVRPRVPRPELVNTAVGPSAPQATVPLPPPRPIPSDPPVFSSPSGSRNVNLTPKDDFDDDSEAKTIPAAALPDEIRQLRRRIVEEADAKKRAQELLTPARAGDIASRTTQRETMPDPESLPPGPPVSRSPPPQRAPTPPRVPDAAPRRSETGETLSITHKQDWRDDDAQRTTIAPRDLQGSADDFVPTRSDKYSPSNTNDALDAVASRRGRNLLLVVLAVLAVVVVVGTLVLLDVIPFYWRPQAGALASQTLRRPA